MMGIAESRGNDEVPIACRLGAEEMAEWRDGIGRTVFQGFEEICERPDGYALRYAGDDAWAQTLVEFIVHERACCPFFTFSMDFEPNQGAIWLSIGGSADIKAFVGQLMTEAKGQ